MLSSSSLFFLGNIKDSTEDCLVVKVLKEISETETNHVRKREPLTLLLSELLDQVGDNAGAEQI